MKEACEDMSKRREGGTREEGERESAGEEVVFVAEDFADFFAEIWKEKWP